MTPTVTCLRQSGDLQHELAVCEDDQPAARLNFLCRRAGLGQPLGPTKAEGLKTLGADCLKVLPRRNHSLEEVFLTCESRSPQRHGHEGIVMASHTLVQVPALQNLNLCVVSLGGALR
jgi:hypothetical protein